MDASRAPRSDDAPGGGARVCLERVGRRGRERKFEGVMMTVAVRVMVFRFGEA